MFPKHRHSPFEAKVLPGRQLSCTTKCRRVWAPTRDTAGALQCPSSTPAQPTPNKQSSKGTLASSARSHRSQSWQLFCRTASCIQTSPCTAPPCSNHLRRPQQITGFPPHSAQPLIPNLIHYNMLIITLRLSQVPGIQALINPPGSLSSNANERRKNVQERNAAN